MLRRLSMLPDQRDARLLTVSTFVNCLGLGLVLAAGSIYLVRCADLSANAVGLGLTLGGLAGLGAGLLIGDLADHRGAREVTIATMCVEATASIGFIFINNLWTLAAVAAVAAVGRSGGGSAAGAMIGLLAESGEAARLRAYVRAAANAGIAVGMVGAAIVLALDDRAAYDAMFLFDAFTFLVAAAVVGRIRRLPPSRSTGDETVEAVDRWAALKDVRYLAFTVASAVASFQYFVLATALPLWIVLHTDAPRWLNALLLFLAAALVAAIQVPATRAIADQRSAGRAILRSAPLFLLSWIAIAVTGRPSAVLASAILVGAVIVHSVAEVWQAGGTFELSYSLARPQAQGQYLGAFGIGTGLAEALAPAIVIALCVNWGPPGWVTLAGIVALASLACRWLSEPVAGERTASASASVGSS